MAPMLNVASLRSTRTLRNGIVVIKHFCTATSLTPKYAITLRDCAMKIKSSEKQVGEWGSTNTFSYPGYSLWARNEAESVEGMDYDMENVQCPDNLDNIPSIMDFGILRVSMSTY